MDLQEHKLDASSRPKVLYSYTVSGVGHFPFDMLRYDQAWFRDSYGTSDFMPENGVIKEFRLSSYHQPTVDRWLSFGWRVA